MSMPIKRRSLKTATERESRFRARRCTPTRRIRLFTFDNVRSICTRLPHLKSLIQPEPSRTKHPISTPLIWRTNGGLWNDGAHVAEISHGMYTKTRSLLLLFCSVLLAMWPCNGQQHPVVPISGPDTPKGCLFPFQDSHGRLWLAGCETGREGVYAFDGLRFLSPQGDMDGAGVSGMVEDTSEGIWLASTHGLFRISQGKLAKVFDGVAFAGITQIAPDVFLLAMSHQGGTAQSSIDAVRVSRGENGWRLDSVFAGVGDVKFVLDASGNVLYGCDDGYCELQANAIVRWRSGQQLAVRSHKLGTGQEYTRRAAVVLRDRYGCVWLRNTTTVTYQCRTDGPASRLASPAIGNGIPLLYELRDGSILIPSFAKIAIGRPGKVQTVPINTHGPTIPLRDGGLMAVGLELSALSAKASWGGVLGRLGRAWRQHVVSISTGTKDVCPRR